MKRAAKVPLPSAQYVRDAQWIARNYTRLSKKYPNQWVAVHKGKVVAVADDLGRARRMARKRTGTDEFPVQLVDDGTIIFRVLHFPLG